MVQNIQKANYKLVKIEDNNEKRKNKRLKTRMIDD